MNFTLPATGNIYIYIYSWWFKNQWQPTSPAGTILSFFSLPPIWYLELTPRVTTPSLEHKMSCHESCWTCDVGKCVENLGCMRQCLDLVCWLWGLGGGTTPWDNSWSWLLSFIDYKQRGLWIVFAVILLLLVHIHLHWGVYWPAWEWRTASTIGIW